MSNARPRGTVLCIAGPTAAGKTALACALADQLPVDLISVDSALVYRGMDIGTGKPTAADLQRWPHQLIDLCDPAEIYSAARFAEDASLAIAQSFARGRIPLLVGGTMLYFKALQEGLSDLPASNAETRARLQAELAERGLATLHAELAQVDPQAAARIRASDPQRTLRALEVFRLTGKPLSAFWADGVQASRFHFHQIAVLPADRAALHARIGERFHGMVKAGLLDEVAALRARSDLHPDLPSIRCVGYRQAWAHLAGETDHAGFLEQGMAATRQLAKRQLTWLRQWPLNFSVPDASETSLQAVLKHLQTAPI